MDTEYDKTFKALGIEKSVFDSIIANEEANGKIFQRLTEEFESGGEAAEIASALLQYMADKEEAEKKDEADSPFYRGDAGKFEEDLHPRGKDGRFIKGNGEKSSSRSEPLYNSRGIDESTGRTRSGVSLAEQLRKDYGGTTRKSVGWGKYKEVPAYYNAFEDYKLASIKEMNSMSEEDKKKAFDRFLDVVERNGDPRPDGKNVIYGIPYNDRNASAERRGEILKEHGFSDDELEYAQDVMKQWTEGDWNEADTDVIERYIKDSPDVYGGELHRGIHLSVDDARNMVRDMSDGEITFGRISSWSESEDVAADFATDCKTNEIAIVFTIPAGFNRTAVNVGQFSKFSEKEAISGKDATYSVLAIRRVGIGYPKTRLGYEVTLMERGKEHDN